MFAFFSHVRVYWHTVRWYVRIYVYKLDALLQYPAMRRELRRQRRLSPYVSFAVGDSHARFSLAGVRGMIRLHLGPVTMHRVGRDGLNSFPLFSDGSEPWNKQILKRGDRVFLFFGEIDCRCHIGTQRTLGRTEEEIMETLAEKYVTAIVNAKTDGVTYVIVSVPPPAYAKHLFDVVSYAPNGSDEERSRYTASLNRLLRQKAEENGIPYFDLYKEYTDAHGMLIFSLSDGKTHIGNTERATALYYDTMGTA